MYESLLQKHRATRICFEAKVLKAGPSEFEAVQSKLSLSDAVRRLLLLSVLRDSRALLPSSMRCMRARREGSGKVEGEREGGRDGGSDRKIEGVREE
eukprot:6182963-Pleurochrysis_carterae.AAC.2